MPDKLREYVNTEILRRREPAELDDRSVSNVIKVAARIAESAESQTAKLIATVMFPIENDGIVEGGNSQWSTVALPNNPQYPHTLSAPKPDLHLGYAYGQGSDWSLAQASVIGSAIARPYALPTRDNAFPFFMIEMKSEPAGGTLYEAENQAAGSGSCSVNTLLWLFKEAGLTSDLSVVDTVAFSTVANHRNASFYVHWYSEEESLLYMSCFRSYSTREPQDIRACSSTVTNIIEYGLGARKEKIGKALTALFPFPENWKQRQSVRDRWSASRAPLSEGSTP